MNGGGYFEKQKNGEYTWAKEKIGGVGLKEGKNGGSTLRGRKKWGEYTLAAEGQVIMSTPPQDIQILHY